VTENCCLEIALFGQLSSGGTEYFLFNSKAFDMTKRLFKTALLTGIPFGVLMGLFFLFIFRSPNSIFLGLACGVAFGMFLAIFTEIQRKKMESTDGTFEGEAIVFQGPANHFFNGESRGGWLTLTPSKLAFRSHGMNAQNQNLDIDLEELAEVVTSLTLGIIPNGLRVVLRTGRKESFVLYDREKWRKLIALSYITGSNGENLLCNKQD
jgi:hypothetical protein